jgi:two-component system nitrate/nitrite response regulator NarL
MLEDELSVVPTPIRLVVAGDDALVVACLEELLRREKDFEVIPRWGKEETILFALSAFRPDVLVLDLPPAGGQGLALLRKMKAMKLAARVVLLCAPLPEEQLQEAIGLGVGGVLPKDAAPEVLANCIRGVHVGRQWLGEQRSGLALARTPNSAAAFRNQIRALTPREIEVVRLVCAGLRNKQIASRLEVTEGTVKTHLHRIYEKLTVRGRLELSLYGRNTSADASPPSE